MKRGKKASLGLGRDQKHETYKGDCHGNRSVSLCTRIGEALGTVFPARCAARTSLSSLRDWVTPNVDVKQSIEDARATVAFYASLQQYEEYFAAHGFRTEARKPQEGVKHGDYRSTAHLVPDEMASTFLVTGTPDEVAKKIEPVWEFADSLCLIPPVLTIELDKSLAYMMTIAQTFYL